MYARILLPFLCVALLISTNALSQDASSNTGTGSGTGGSGVVATGCNPATTRCLGSACSASNAGVSMMDKPGDNIIVCLKATATSSTYVWKTQTGNGAPGAYLEVAWCSVFGCNAPTCMGTNPFTGSCSCPLGASATKISASMIGSWGELGQWASGYICTYSP